MNGLLAETRWVDVSIPLAGGLLLLFRPKWAVRSTASPEKDEAKQSLARVGGVILLVVAGIYYLTSTFSIPPL